MMCALEEAARTMEANGVNEQWLKDSAPAIKTLCGKVNGPLLHALAEATEYQDMACIDMLRSGVLVTNVYFTRVNVTLLGTRLLGTLPRSGIGEWQDLGVEKSKEVLHFLV